MRNNTISLRIVMTVPDFNAGYRGRFYTHEVYRTFRHKDEMYGLTERERVVDESLFRSLYPERADEFLDAMSNGKTVVGIYRDIEDSKDVDVEFVEVGTPYCNDWRMLSDVKATDTGWYERQLYKNSWAYKMLNNEAV